LRGCAAVRRSVGRGLTHLTGRIAELTRGVGEVLPWLLTRQLFELARGFLELLRELALVVGAQAAAGRALLHPGRPLGFLLLALPHFLELVGELVDLLVARLLVGALLHFVLVRELVHLELEQVGKVLRLLLAATTAAATTALLLHLHFV